MWTSLRVVWAIGKRELFAYALSPISYLVAALFLVVQGQSFWLLCRLLSASNASLGTVLGSFFGGTFLYWLFLLFIVSLLTMRLFAEERQRSALDLLLSTAASEGALCIGKFLGALGFYLALWLPTLAYLGLLRLYLGPAAILDSGPILGGYLGTLLCGMSALGIGVLASVLAPTPLLAAALTFVSLSLILLSGTLADFYVENPQLQAVLAYGNLFQHMDELSRGILDSRRVLYHLSLTVLALVLSARCLRTRAGDRRGAMQTGLWALVGLGIFVGLNFMAARLPRRWDLTRAGEYRLAPELRQIVQSLATQQHFVTVRVFYGDFAARDERFVRLRETLLQAEVAAAGRLHLVFLHIEHQREAARLTAERYHIERDDLGQGVVVLESAGRSKLLFPADLGEFSTVEAGSQPRLGAYRGEEALGTAILLVTLGRTPNLCFTQGHGEAEYDSYTGTGLSDLATAIRRENLQLHTLDMAAAQKTLRTQCDVVIIAGTQRPFLPEEAAALEQYLDGGGRLLVLAGALIDRGLSQFLNTGLESLLLQRGVRLGQAVVIDPPQRLAQSLALIVENTYGEHPISAGFVGRRTLWPLPRPVFPLAALEPAGGSAAPVPGTGHSGLLWRARSLAMTSLEGFGETNLSALRQKGQEPPSPPAPEKASRIAGPVPLAVAAEPLLATQNARIVVIGSTQLAWNDSLVLFNRDFLLAAIKWLADVPLSLSIAPRKPLELRVKLTAAQEERLFLVLVLGLPGLVLLLGMGIRWVRRSGA